MLGNGVAIGCRCASQQRPEVTHSPLRSTDLTSIAQPVAPQRLSETVDWALYHRLLPPAPQRRNPVRAWRVSQKRPLRISLREYATYSSPGNDLRPVRHRSSHPSFDRVSRFTAQSRISFEFAARLLSSSYTSGKQDQSVSSCDIPIRSSLSVSSQRGMH